MDETLVELFSSKVRAAVLGHLLPRPHLAASLTELSHLLDLPVSSLQHECYKLVRLGVLSDRREGNSRPYRVNRDSPFVPPLTALVVAALGQEAALRAAVDGVPSLTEAFLSGTLPAAGPARLVLIGELPLDLLDAMVERVAGVLGLDVNQIDLAFFRPADWSARREAFNPYVADLLDGPRVVLR